jgi:D-arabinose 1-dehydrogenase-like Zn-dependent alcohol dehydrogenase
VGTEVPVWREGDRVAIYAGKPCLSCRACASGLIEDCADPRVMGAHYDGAWAEYVAVLWFALARLPDSVSFEHGAIACDAVSTPYAALVDPAEASVSGTYALDRAAEAVDRLRSKAGDPVRLLLGPTA